jgi:hypothetical protein
MYVTWGEGGTYPSCVGRGAPLPPPPLVGGVGTPLVGSGIITEIAMDSRRPEWCPAADHNVCYKNILCRHSILNDYIQLWMKFFL